MKYSSGHPLYFCFLLSLLILPRTRDIEQNVKLSQKGREPARSRSSENPRKDQITRFQRRLRQSRSTRCLHDHWQRNLYSGGGRDFKQSGKKSFLLQKIASAAFSLKVSSGFF